jgi:hypothetical protein
MTHPMSDHIPLMRIRPAEVHEAEALASIAWPPKRHGATLGLSSRRGEKDLLPPVNQSACNPHTSRSSTMAWLGSAN